MLDRVGRETAGIHHGDDGGSKERAEEALAILEAGRTDPLANSGYGYEHMGDMARDLEPLARDVLALRAQHELDQQIIHGYSVRVGELESENERLRKAAAAVIGPRGRAAGFDIPEIEGLRGALTDEGAPT